MTHITETSTNEPVDKTLVAMFLKMTPEERLQANDNMVRTILELRDAYRKQKTRTPGSEPTP